VGGHEDGPSASDVVLEELPQLPLVDRVEVDEGLVQEDEGRLVQEGGRQHELLSRPLREILAQVRACILEIEELEPPSDPALEALDLPDLADEIEVLV